MMGLGAIWAAVSSRLGQMTATAMGVLALLGGAYLHGRRTATDSARARAAEAEQEARRRGDEAARAADRDSVTDRLRRGDF